MNKVQEAMMRIQKQAAGEMPPEAAQQVPPEAMQQMPPPEAMQQVPPEMLQQMAPEQLAAMQEQPMPQEQLPPEAMQQGAQQGQPSIEQLIVLKLQAAFCAEMNSWYQYVWAIVNGHGPDRNAFIQECEEHAKHELEHAYAIAAEIKKLTGVVPFGLIPFSLAECFQGNPCPSVQEIEGNVLTPILTQQIIEAEECAVQLYEELSQLTGEAYPDVQDTINGILATERDHVVDMSEILMTIGIGSGTDTAAPEQPEA